MGTDIHATFQAKKNGVWKEIDVSSWDRARNYELFEWLGDPRGTADEGVGFDIVCLGAWDLDFEENSDIFNFNKDSEVFNAYHNLAYVTPKIADKKRNFIPQSLNWFLFMLDLLEEQNGEVRMYYGYDN